MELHEIFGLNSTEDEVAGTNLQLSERIYENCINSVNTCAVSAHLDTSQSVDPDKDFMNPVPLTRMRGSKHYYLLPEETPFLEKIPPAKKPRQYILFILDRN